MTKFNFYLGAATSAWMLTILIIIAELYEPFKNLLKSTFSHHWIGKALIITFAFLVFGIALKDKNSIGNVQDDKFAWYGMLGSLIAIFLFFVIEFVK